MTGQLKGKGTRGFTLIEVLVVVAIAGFISVVAASAFSLVVTRSSKDFADTMVKSQVQMAGNWISRDVVGATPDTIVAPVSGNVVCSMGRFNIVSGTTDNITYEIINQQMVRRVVNTLGATQHIIAQDIDVRPATKFELLDSSLPKTYKLIVSSTDTYRNRSYSQTFIMTRRMP